MSVKINLNADIGEGHGAYDIGNDAAIMKIVGSVNVACGFHGSDPNHMRSTVRLAKAHAVAVGAHPSLPDLQGFGRREMKIPRAELANIIIYQVGALTGFLEAEGLPLNHIKPHGALYAMAARHHRAEEAGQEADLRRAAAREKLPVSTNAKKSSSHAIRIVEIWGVW